MRIVIICLIVSLFLYNMHYWSSINPKYEILQTDLQNINVNLLLERLPIVINESIVEPNDLTGTVFSYLYVLKQHTKTVPRKHYQVTARYAVLFGTHDKNKVEIVHPAFKDTPVDITLNQNQVLILPHKWTYWTEFDAVSIKLFDLTSLLTIF